MLTVRFRGEFVSSSGHRYGAWERMSAEPAPGVERPIRMASAARITEAMPDVSLFTATEPVSEDTPIVIRYSIEVGGLQVYNESYDVDKLAHDVKQDQAKAVELWARRLLCVIHARRRPGFSAAVTRCLGDGRCCDHGTEACIKIDDVGVPTS
jgi:hypothetical protein